MGWNEEEIKAFEADGDKVADKYISQLIPDLENVIDVQSSGAYTIAVCSTNNKQLGLIISNWCRVHQTPEDIIKLIKLQ